MDQSLPPKSDLILLGAVAGDMIGAPYEYSDWKQYDFPLFSSKSAFTDDSVLTLAVAQAILLGEDYSAPLLRFARQYPGADYGGSFCRWMASPDPQPYNSLGNGSAMRVSAVGWAFDTLEETMRQAKMSAAPTHNHPEGVKGAQATAAAIFLIRQGIGRQALRSYIEDSFGYDLHSTCDAIRQKYTYDVTCPGTVPPAMIAFLESDSYEDAVRRAVSLGGDADTLGAITGAMAEAAYGVASDIAEEVRSRLPAVLWEIIVAFSEKYAAGRPKG